MTKHEKSVTLLIAQMNNKRERVLLDAKGARDSAKEEVSLVHHRLERARKLFEQSEAAFQKALKTYANINCHIPDRYLNLPLAVADPIVQTTEKAS